MLPQVSDLAVSRNTAWASIISYHVRTNECYYEAFLDKVREVVGE